MNPLTSYPPSSRPVEFFTLDDLKPAVVVAPADKSSVAAALQAIAAEEKVCVPWGGGTRQGEGFLPTRYDVALSTENLSRLVDLQPNDLTVTVEAGMTIAKLQEILARNSQFVALESGKPDQETVGGVIATGASALLRYAYGTPRDQVIGITVAMPDGELVRGGGRVVKNVAGYDLCKLFTGSMGTLGIIVEVTLRVRPLPAVHRTWLGRFSSAGATEKALSALMDSALQPSFLQAADPAMLKEIAYAIPGLGYPEQDSWALALGADGDEMLSQWMVEEASRLAHASESTTVAGDTALKLREWLTAWCGPQMDLSVRVSVPSSRVLALMEYCKAYCTAEKGIEARTLAAAGNGVIFFNFGLDPQKQEAERFAGASRLVEWLAEQAVELSGFCVVLRSPADLRSQMPMWGRPSPNRSLMGSIRARLDPRWTLNRGRLLEDEA